MDRDAPLKAGMQTFPWWELFAIHLGWGPRAESLDACAARLARFVSLLEPLSPHLAGLRSAWGANGQLIRFDVTGDACGPMFLRAKSGFQFQGSLEFDPGHQLPLHILAGAEQSLGSVFLPELHNTNNVTLSAVVKDVAGVDAPIIAGLKPMLLAAIEAWEPDCATINAHHYRQPPLFSGARSFATGCWAIYLASALARNIAPPPDCIAESTPAGDLLMMATDGLFSHEDPALRATAEAIQAAVAPLNL